MKISFSPFMQLSIILAVLISSVAAAPDPSFAIPLKSNTKQILEKLGGSPCPEDSSFTCVTIHVPLDHFHPADTRTIPVVFAVLPASGTRKGMFVVATGGPGTSGVLLADSYSAGYDPNLLKSFDIVFFDQRGMGLSGGLTCPVAAAEYYQKDFRGITRQQEKSLKKVAGTFAADCVNEVGSTDLLPYLGTKQAVEDLEAFRRIIGDKKFWLYGESYGTQYAQTYAAAHGDHLAGLILDGTVDLTFNGIDYYSQQAQAFNDTLVASLSTCDNDPVCAKTTSGDAVAAYDRLAAQLSKSDLSLKFPLPGGFKNRNFTLSDFEFVAASQMYNESDRMIFTRALSAYTANSDLAPLARLLYLDLAIDPKTLAVVPDPSWSDAVFYGVECQDYGYPGNTPDRKAENYLDAADPFETSIPRLASIIYGDLPCAYWPNPTSNLTRPKYLVAEGVPTLVLGATADPATPVSHGINVYRHLADGYLITTDGGPHVTFGYGKECPDALVTDFLVNNVRPAQRETICKGVVADDYVPLAPPTAAEFQDPAEALSSAETEIDYLPEYFYWDGFTPTSTGCTYGGAFSFTLSESGTKDNFVLNRCEFSSNFRMTGVGSYTPETDRFTLSVKTTGRWTCDLRYAHKGERITLSGICNGKSVSIDRVDPNRIQPQLPNRKEEQKVNQS